MACSESKPSLTRAKNGVVAPLYFDRQIVRAEDLTLDRDSHDAELARMRRLLHGWGIVAGLIPVIGPNNVLAISAGYGITRTGDEVYLPEAVAVGGIDARVRACCGPEGPTCEVIDLERRDRLADAQEDKVESWLIARPERITGEPRPGIPAGCEHPANKLLPTRACGVVSFELLCELPAGMAGGLPSCTKLMPFVCGRPRSMLPMPPKPKPEQNFLVLGKIVVDPNGNTDRARFEPESRSAVLPLSVVQDWLQACVCRGFDNQDERPPENAIDDMGWQDLTDHLKGNGFIEEKEQPGRPSLPRILVEVDVRRRLEDKGVNGPGSFLQADTADLAEKLGLTSADIEDLAEELEAFRAFFADTDF